MGDKIDNGPNAALIGREGSRWQLSTPALVLDYEAMRGNLQAVAQRARDGGARLRPHTKGGKSVKLALMQLELGAIGICCTTLGEAEVMSAGGVGDILITSPVVGESMLQRLAELRRLNPNLMVVADCDSHLAGYARLAEATGARLSVLIDFDVGQGRTGARSEAEAVRLGRAVAGKGSLVLKGIQAYYGHLQHVATAAARRDAVQAQVARIRSVVAAFGAAGLACDVVSGGGTGTFEIDMAERIFTELQLGSYPFLDREYCEIESMSPGALQLAPALFVQASVVSASQSGLAIVNAGYKSFATEGGPPILHHPAMATTAYRLMGDEHGGVDYDPAQGRLAVGDKLEFLAPHCDPTINLYDHYHCVRGDTLIDIWPVDARGR